MNTNNLNNSNNTFTLTTYETRAVDQYGNNYIAIKSRSRCKGCAFAKLSDDDYGNIGRFCTPSHRIDGHYIIWQKVENLPIINIPISTLRHLLIESLLSIRNGTKRDNYLRLCSNLYINLVNELNFCEYSSLLSMLSIESVRKFCQSWKYYLGNPDFPIPNDSIGGNYLLWEGDNLIYRISLIDHLIENIKGAEFEQFAINIINEYIAGTK